MATWFKVHKWGTPLVSRVEVVRETAEFVVLEGGRREKKFGYDTYYPTERQAWERIKLNALTSQNIAKDKLRYAEKHIQEADEALARL